jgi:predicted nuclease of predicted toxin-antitoxin system
VKFLIDNQLPRALCQFLVARGCDAEHVLDIGLEKAPDAEIWEYALRNGRAVISKDEDFFYLATRPGSKVCFIWVRLGNCRTSALLDAFERLWPRLTSAVEAGDHVIELW